MVVWKKLERNDRQQLERFLRFCRPRLKDANALFVSSERRKELSSGLCTYRRIADGVFLLLYVLSYLNGYSGKGCAGVERLCLWRYRGIGSLLGGNAGESNLRESDFTKIWFILKKIVWCEDF